MFYVAIYLNSRNDIVEIYTCVKDITIKEKKKYIMVTFYLQYILLKLRK